MKLSFSDQKPLKAIDVVVKAMKGVKHKVPVSLFFRNIPVRWPLLTQSHSLPGRGKHKSGKANGAE